MNDLRQVRLHQLSIALAFTEILDHTFLSSIFTLLTPHAYYSQISSSYSPSMVSQSTSGLNLLFHMDLPKMLFSMLFSIQIHTTSIYPFVYQLVVAIYPPFHSLFGYPLILHPIYMTCPFQFS